MSKLHTHARALAPAIAMAAALTFGGGANAGVDEPMPDGAFYFEGFDDETSLSSDWTPINNSSPTGVTGWSIDTFFTDSSTEIGSFATADFNNTITQGGTISNWLISPTMTFNNGDVVKFWTRTVDPALYADRLELRFSPVGGTDVGEDEESVGDFSVLLRTVNPSLTTAPYDPDLTPPFEDDESGYPISWAEITGLPISGLTGPTNGAIAFRYFVTDAGFSGSNSEKIGIDSVSITAGQAIPPAVPEPATYLMMALGLGAIGLRRMRAMRS